MQLEIFFPTSYDATMASYLIAGSGSQVGEPRMVARPLDGRSWVLDVEMPTMSSAERYVASEQGSIVQQAIQQYDGQIPGNEYAHLADS